MKKKILSVLIVILIIMASVPVSAIGVFADSVKTEAQAVEYIKEQLLARNTSFSFNCNTGKTPQELLNLALAHTGNSSEGDYLRNNINSYRYGYGSYSNYFRFEFSDFVYYATKSQEMQVDSAVASFIRNNITNGMSDIEKVTAIYDFITHNVQYDGESESLSKYSAYAAICNKNAVCNGYALLLYKMLLYVGIDTRIITGVVGGNENHAWNIAKLGGEYYYLDSTWDAGVTNDYYSYFLMGSYAFEVTHFAESQFKTEDFKSNYPISYDDYYVYTLTPSTAAYVSPFSFTTIDGDIITEKDIYRRKTLYIYCQADEGPTDTYLNFLVNNGNMDILKSADINVMGIFSDRPTDQKWQEYIDSFPDITFVCDDNSYKQWWDVTSLLGDDPTQENFYFPIVALANSQGIYVHYSEGAVTLYVNYIPHLIGLSNLEYKLEYDSYDTFACDSFNYPLLNGGSAKKSDYAGKNLLMTYVTVGYEYSEMYLDNLKKYNETLKKLNIDVLVVPLNFDDVTENDIRSLAENYPEFKFATEIPSGDNTFYYGLTGYQDGDASYWSSAVTFLVNQSGNYVYFKNEGYMQFSFSDVNAFKNILFKNCDVNNDGNVDALDLSSLCDGILNNTSSLNFDVNNDGKVNILDLVKLKVFLAA